MSFRKEGESRWRRVRVIHWSGVVTSSWLNASTWRTCSLSIYSPWQCQSCQVNTGNRIVRVTCPPDSRPGQSLQIKVPVDPSGSSSGPFLLILQMFKESMIQTWEEELLRTWSPFLPVFLVVSNSRLLFDVRNSLWHWDMPPECSAWNAGSNRTSPTPRRYRSD